MPIESNIQEWVEESPQWSRSKHHTTRGETPGVLTLGRVDRPERYSQNNRAPTKPYDLGVRHVSNALCF